MRPKQKTNEAETHIPLASIIRPKTLSEVIGQQHLIGEGKPLYKVVEQKVLFSMIFWGPPGVGKTTLARILAESLNASFVELSAVSAGKADIRQVVEAAKLHPEIQTILFLDEIHRFNKAQQDFLLPHVESGILTLIGATTENPSFEVIPPLLSRCRVFVLKQLSTEEIELVILRSLQVLGITMDKEAKEWLTRIANGDARQTITILENTRKLYPNKKKINKEVLEQSLQTSFLRYDPHGEEHHNTISAYIKSMRAGNVDASLYYLARMVAAGEDPLYVARRMVVFASEDVASPTALVVANAVFQACQQVGLPECQENLAAGTVYLANSPKDRSAYDAYMKALEDATSFGNLPIPLSLLNAPTKLMKDLNYGKGYEMYSKTSLLPDDIASHKYYFPKEKGMKNNS